VGDIVTYRQDRGIDRTWVPKDQESWWIAFWGRGGVPAARWKDYLAWGRRFYPPPEVDGIRRNGMLHRARRKRTNYAKWSPPEGY
jgi:hypothetical protein